MSKQDEPSIQFHILALNGEIQKLSLGLVSTFNNLQRGEHLPAAVARYIFRRTYSYYEQGGNFGGELWNTIANFLCECHPFYRLFLVGEKKQKEDFCRDFCFEALNYLQLQPESNYYQDAIADILAVYYDEGYTSHGYFDDYKKAYNIVETVMIAVTRNRHKKTPSHLQYFYRRSKNFA